MLPLHRMDREIVYRVSTRGSGWELSEERMPESVLHDEVVKLLVAVLDAWSRGKAMRIARNLAVRWDAARPASRRLEIEVAVR